MKRFGWILGALLISGILYVTAAQCPMCRAPMGPRPGAGFGNGPGMGMRMGMGPRRQMMRKQMMENGERATIRGRVVSIEPMDQGPALRMMVESDSRVIPVMIGPRMPLDQLSEPIEAGDRVEVCGLKVDRMGRDVFVAHKLTMDESGETIRIERRAEGGPPMMGDRQPFMNDGPPMMDQRPMHPRGPWHKHAI